MPPSATTDTYANPPPTKRRRVSSSATDVDMDLFPSTIKINVSGAYIIDHVDNSPSPPSPASLDSETEQQNTLQSDDGGYEHDRRDIRLPNHTSVVSHVAADIGGSLAKVVYFSQEVGRRGSGLEGAVDDAPAEDVRGGRLHFLRFETERIDQCIEFMRELQVKQRQGWAQAKDGKRRNKESELCVMATGGGAFKYYDRIKERLGVDVVREDEMTCLIQGLDFFITEIPNEVFTFHEDEEEQIQYRSIESQRTVYPYLLVNIGSGVSMIKVSGPDNFQRIGGTSLGGGTLWGLLSLLTGARTFDQMLAMADKGENGNVDLLVGDIYGEGLGYEKIGLSEKTIASTFGKVFKRKREAERNAEDGQNLGKGKTTDEKTHDQKKQKITETPVEAEVGDGRMFNPQDISRSLLYAVSNNIGQIAYLQSEKHNLKHIYFGGSFIRGHRQTIHTLSYAIKFWSKGSKQAYFLRHEGYLGAVGAFLKRQPRNFGRRGSSVGVRESIERGEVMSYPTA
ncbi:hypothetical protein AAFC00_006017 [Neodothiora populina]|uniref:Pantothenate kinase n=1 Tax=Neodothiora populina TaxID=2781224 RepID=A0ABR3P6N3_9PEZI